MNKKTLRIAGWALGLSMAFGVGGGLFHANKAPTQEAKATATSYTITFKTGTGDGSSASTSTSFANTVSDGGSYGTGNLATATNAYHSGGSGLKLGTSSGAGVFKFNLSGAGQVTPTSIVVSAKRYNSSKAATLAVNGKVAQSLTGSFANYSFTGFDADITYIQLNSSKYCWVESITVNYDDGAAEIDSLSNKLSDYNIGLGSTLDLRTCVNAAGSGALAFSFDANDYVQLNADGYTLETKDGAAAGGTIVITATKENVATPVYFNVHTIDPGQGTVEKPYSVAEAYGLIDGKNNPEGVYVKGIISQVVEVNTGYGNATFWITDDGLDSETKIEAYRCRYLENAAFTDSSQIQVGDIVVLYGDTTIYSGIKEFTAGCYIYSLVHETVSINASSLSGLKGDTDTSLSLTVGGFTGSGLSISYSNAGVATVSGTPKDGGYDLSVRFDSIGTTTATIVVDGSNTGAKSVTLNIEVKAKPKTLTLNNAAISEGRIEVKRGGSRNITFSGTDMDDDVLTVNFGDLNATIAEGGSSFIHLTGTTNCVINGDAVGSTTITYAYKSRPTVTASLVVNVVEDYIESVGSIVFNEGLAANIGQSVKGIESTLYSSRTANLHFGSTTDIPLDDFKYSYTNVYEDAVAASNLLFDFAYGVGTTADGEGNERKIQTIYVFYKTETVNWSGSFTITVTEVLVHISSIAISNSECVDDEIVLDRNTSIDLAIAITPEETTDSKVMTYELSGKSDGCSIALEGNRLSAGSVIGSSATLTVTSVNGKTATASVRVVREKQTLALDKPIVKASSIAVGDKLVFAVEKGDTKKYMNGVTTYGAVVDYASEATVPTVASAFVVTVEAGNGGNGYSFKNGQKYLNWSSNNTLELSDDKTDNSTWTVSITDYKATIKNASDTNRQLWYNISSPRFACYTSKTEGNSYCLPFLYKAETSMEISDDMFDAVQLIYSENYLSCNADHSKSIIDWSNVEEALELGTTDAEYSNLKYAEAKATSAGGNEFENFLAQYDHLVSNYGGAYADFLGRYDEGGINAGAFIFAPAINQTSDNNSAIWLLAVTTMALAAAGGVFLLARKRHDEE